MGIDDLRIYGELIDRHPKAVRRAEKKHKKGGKHKEPRTFEIVRSLLDTSLDESCFSKDNRKAQRKYHKVLFELALPLSPPSKSGSPKRELVLNGEYWGEEKISRVVDSVSKLVVPFRVGIRFLPAGKHSVESLVSIVDPRAPLVASQEMKVNDDGFIEPKIPFVVGGERPDSGSLRIPGSPDNILLARALIYDAHTVMELEAARQADQRATRANGHH